MDIQCSTSGDKVVRLQDPIFLLGRQIIEDETNTLFPNNGKLLQHDAASNYGRKDCSVNNPASYI